MAPKRACVDKPTPVLTESPLQLQCNRPRKEVTKQEQEIENLQQQVLPLTQKVQQLTEALEEVGHPNTETSFGESELRECKHLKPNPETPKYPKLEPASLNSGSESEFRNKWHLSDPFGLGVYGEAEGLSK